MTNVLARTGVLGKHQPTLVALDDLPGDRHPEPGTLRELAGASVEAVEDPVPILVGDPGTLIADCYPGPALVMVVPPVPAGPRWTASSTRPGRGRPGPLASRRSI